MQMNDWILFLTFVTMVYVWFEISNYLINGHD